MLRSLGLALAAILTLVGCPGGGSQATPKDTVQTMNAALMAGNRDQFLACWKASVDEKKALDAAFDMSQQFRNLKSAITKAYGADGWKKFKGPMGDESAMGIEGLDQEKLAQMKVDVQGDRATAAIPGQGKPLNLEKDGGKWLIEAKPMAQGGGSPDQMKKMVDMMKQPIQKVISEAGKPGQTPESLAQMMQAEMMKASMGAAAQFMEGEKAVVPPMPPPGKK